MHDLAAYNCRRRRFDTMPVYLFGVLDLDDFNGNT